MGFDASFRDTDGEHLRGCSLSGTPRVAFFPDAYWEVDGVAMYARHFEAHAKRNHLPLFLVHAGKENKITQDGSVTRIELQRGPLTFPLDKAHSFDSHFLRHAKKVSVLLRNFRPDLVQITGPSDVGVLGTWLARKCNVPLAAFWQTDLPGFAKMRVAQSLGFLPQPLASKLARVAEHGSEAITTRFYKLPKMVFAPNQEIVDQLTAATKKRCHHMGHGVDLELFHPEKRDRQVTQFSQAEPFIIGYVGRLSAEKNIRWLARLEQRLEEQGHRDFRIVVVGQGAESAWLRDNMKRVEFCGVLSGNELARAYANMDVLAFPSETDTFGLVVLEALASGVPAVVTARGGPKFTVQDGKTGYVAKDFDGFAAGVLALMTQPEKLSEMRVAAREHALSHSWEQVFENIYKSYDRCQPLADTLKAGQANVATPAY